MRQIAAFILMAIAGCTGPVPMEANSLLRVRGTEAQISALLADENVKIGPTVSLVSDKHVANGMRELRYKFASNAPYKDIGGLVFYARSHGAETDFESWR